MIAGAALLHLLPFLPRPLPPLRRPDWLAPAASPSVETSCARAPSAGDGAVLDVCCLLPAHQAWDAS